MSDLDYADNDALLENEVAAAIAIATVALQMSLEINIIKTEFIALNVPDGHQHVSVQGQEFNRVMIGNMIFSFLLVYCQEKLN